MDVTNLFSALSGLASVDRFSMTKLCEPESVLEHSGWVALVSVILAGEMNVIDSGMSMIDVGKVATMALMHDLDEIITGDVPRPTKYRNEDTIKAFKEMSRWGVSKIVHAFDVNDSVSLWLIECHGLAKKGREGLVVAIADCMAVVYKIWEEVIVRHNCSMISHGKKLLEQIEDLENDVTTMFSEPVVNYLREVLDQCRMMANRALSMDDSMFGSDLRT